MVWGITAATDIRPPQIQIATDEIRNQNRFYNQENPSVTIRGGFLMIRIVVRWKRLINVIFSSLRLLVSVGRWIG